MSIPQDDNWETCEIGTLVGFSAKSRQKSQRGQMLRMGSGTLVALAVGLLLASVFMEQEPTQQPGRAMGCREVNAHMDRYLTGDLPVAEERLVKTHLRHCEKCQHHYQHRADELGITFSMAMRSAWHYLSTSLLASTR